MGRGGGGGGRGSGAKAFSKLDSRQQAIVRSLSGGAVGLADIPGVTNRGRVTQAGAKAFNALVSSGIVQPTGSTGARGQRFSLTPQGQRLLR